jgi:NADH-quinone oxidoreductase subunit H
MNWLRLLFELIVFPGFLFTLAAGLILTWVDRKITARIQWRVGPPWFQPFADLVKLFSKETLVPEGAPRTIFLLSPLLGVAAMTVISVMLFRMNFHPHETFVGDLIVMVYLLALPPLASVLGGASSKNPLAAVGASREMTLYFAYEVPFLIALVGIIAKSGGALRLGDFVLAQQTDGPFLYSLSGAIFGLVMLLAIQAKLGLVPFDIAEAEQEIMSGPYIEYSGPPLAMFKITRAMMLFVLPIFLLTMLWGGIASWWAAPKFLAVIVLIVLIKNTNPRVRIDQALKFFWIGVTVLSLAGLALAMFRL